MQNKINLQLANISKLVAIDEPEFKPSLSAIIHLLNDDPIEPVWNTINHPVHIIKKIRNIVNTTNGLNEQVDAIEQDGELVDYINTILTNEEFVYNCAECMGL